MKYAKRRDGEVYASMASEVYDVPREVSVTLPDGTKKSMQIMQAIIDKETGDVVIVNDLSKGEFNVTSTIGPSYTSQKDQTIDRLDQMLMNIDPADPIRRILMLKTLKLMDGIEFDDVRDYANMQLVMEGIRKPETPEEEQMLQQAQESKNQPSPEMVLAQAEMLKGKADLMKEERETKKMTLDAENEMIKRQIDSFEAKTNRIDTQISATEAGVNIDYKRIDSLGKQLENIEKMLNLKMSGSQNQQKQQKPSGQNQFEGMSDDELLQQLAAQ